MPNRDPDRRTRLITAGGIVAVVLAGAFALGANMGILDASSDNQAGALAASELLPTTTTTTATPTTAATTATTGTTPTTAALPTYAVDVAGTVTVDATGDVVTLRGVVTNPGWTWTAGPSDATHAEATFTDGTHSLLFTAVRAADGSIGATVDDTTAAPTVSATPTPTTAPSHNDDGREHEGRDDDD